MKNFLFKNVVIPAVYTAGYLAGKLHGVYDVITGKVKRNK